jgi:hypothetical protein
MRKIYYKAAHGIKSGSNAKSTFSKNHYASSAAAYPVDVQNFINQFNMHRVAGNVWVKGAERDFWHVKDGKILKLVGSEVDDHETIQAAPEDAPMNFISSMLEDLEF